MPSAVSLLPLLILASAPFVRGFGFRGFTFKGLKEPEPSQPSTKTMDEKWITQPLDHFNHRDNRTWSMRYYENGEVFNGTGPIMIMLGGEWPIDTGFLDSGLMYNISVLNCGLMFYTEHRYYGNSRPTKDTSTENLRFLNVDQALADVAYFIEVKKKELNLRDNPVIVFGGSYSGNMAVWARLKYPHLIQGAVASSAPVYAKENFHEYYQSVTNSLKRSSEQCAIDVRAAFESIEELLGTDGGAESIRTTFNFCSTPNTTSSSDIAYLMNCLAERFAEVVQQQEILLDGRTSIDDICDCMTTDNGSSPLQRLADIVYNEDECTDYSYDNFLDVHKSVSWDSPASKEGMRQWLYQTCSEYGYYQTTSSKSAFGSKFNIDLYLSICHDLYGEYYNEASLINGIRRTNIMYGGKLPDVTNVIFTNGDVDPWHSLSVLNDLNEHSPAIFINGTSHATVLYGDSPTDSKELKDARLRVRQIIAEWILKHNTKSSSECDQMTKSSGALDAVSRKHIGISNRFHADIRKFRKKPNEEKLTPLSVFQ